MLKKQVVYRFFDSNKPLTHEQLSHYHAFPQFYVYSNGEVVYVSPELPLEEQLKYLTGGKYMTKNQLDELIP